MTDIWTQHSYAELTSRNAGFISPDSQHRLSSALVLVAGCGSTGGAAIGPLTRLGVQRFRLADNGSYELNNLNRQDAALDDVNRNKAEVGAERVRAILPGADVSVVPEGVQSASVAGLVAGVDVVIDGVDVTERSGLLAKWSLHAEAARQRVPVISGYDMAGMQYVRVYDYRRVIAPLAGVITADDLHELSTFQILARIIPRRYVPLEMILDLQASLTEPDYHVSQLVYTSLLFGAVAARLTVDLLDGRRTRTHVAIDLHRATRPRLVNARSLVRTPIEAGRLLRSLR
jgi:ThiF family